MVTRKPVIPSIKKKVNAFLVGEEGKITKEALLKAGVMLSSVALGSALAAKNVTAHGSHTNDFDPDKLHIYDHTTNTASGSHAHHASHGSHGSHANHVL